jgi:hypothetical protein
MLQLDVVFVPMTQPPKKKSPKLISMFWERKTFSGVCDCGNVGQNFGRCCAKWEKVCLQKQLPKKVCLQQKKTSKNSTL